MIRSFQILAAFALIAVLMVTASCSKQGTEHTHDPNVDYYTCSMHPTVKSHDPKGKCPICNMPLIPVYKKTGTTNTPTAQPQGHDHAAMLAGQPTGKGISEDHTSDFFVPTNRQQQIGVTYAAVERKPLRSTIRAVGKVGFNLQQHWDYVARVEGYVEKLFVFSRGEVVEKGQPLLTIYSPDLLTTQRELVNLLRLRDEARAKDSKSAVSSMDGLIESAKFRLSQWNLTDKQIAELEQTRKPQEVLTLYSPFKGVVQDLIVNQGRKAMVGDHLVDVADLSVVWVWAEFYQEELALIKKDLPVTITTSAYPNEKFTGKIVLVDPFMNEATRTGRVRFDIDNPDFKLRPDMYVNVELGLDAGEGMAVPISAVMPTGKHNIVFVDKGAGKLEPRFVELGRKFGDDYAVVSGLKETDRVVASANFLIDAEAKIQGALKSW
jgi:Cu(I)/Ag(I) efflux system membrane fusion protein